MKPNFALNLSHGGIVLLHRSPRGAWTEVGEIALDDPNLRENLSFLRSTAVGLEGKGFGSKLILPDSQILYLEIDAPGPDEDARRAQILAALAGQTPYAVDDLEFDWIASGSKVQVAVVAKETLDEAEEFAVEHRFNPISFVGLVDETPDAWQPFFGRTDYSYAILGKDADVRDTPVAPAKTAADQNLFVEETSTNQPEDAQEPEEAESFFAKDQDQAAGKNIFSQAEEKPEAQPDHTPNKPEPQETPDAGPVAAAFSSRRPVASGTPPDSDAGRPLDRVTSRIAISTAGADESKPEPEDESVPQIIAQDRLRSGFLDNKSATDKSKLAMIPARLALILSSFVRRFRKNKTTEAKPKDSDLSSETPQTSGSAIGKITREGLSKATHGLGRGGRKGALIFKSIGLKAAARLARKKPARGKTNPPPPAQSAGLDEAAEMAPLSTPFADGVGSLAQSQSRKRKAKIAAAAVLAVLGVVGLAYTYLAFEGPGTSPTRGTDDADLTTSAQRGVRADNRARARPGDMAALVAARLATEPDPLTADLAPVRPERRSVFEGQTDPDADLPDTATPVTALTEQELADIRAAGLPVPTQDEISQGGDEVLALELSPVEITAAYEATGILQGLLSPPRPYSDEVRDDIFVAALDRDLQANDANILPDFSTGVQDYPPARWLSPLPPGLVFDLDEHGLVKPTTKGALNPDGILVWRGKPAATPPEKPKTDQLVPPNPLLARKPKARPEGLKTGEDAVFVQGRMTMAQLRARKPKGRPQSEQASLTTGDLTPTELAVLTSFQPAKRPSDFEKTVEKARVRIASTAPATGPIQETGPVLPTRASVAKTATIKNAINLAKINLIGVYGTPSKRNALLRLPSGRFVKVKIGDRVDGGRVAAIGTTSLSYVKAGRSRVLKIPQ